MKPDIRFFSLVKREFYSYINSAQAYVIIAPFLLISIFLYFRSVIVINDANLRPYIDLLPWLLTVIAPALAMKMFGEEDKKGTIELLFAHPLSEWKLVLGKYVGLLAFYGVILLTTLSLPITLLLFSQADIGLIISQYLGAFLLGAMYLSIGVACSAYVKQLVGSFLTAAMICFTLLLVGLQFIYQMVPAPFGNIVAELSPTFHLNNLSRGLVDVRDIFYFLSVIGVALVATVLKLSERRFAEKPVEKQKLLVILALVAGVGLASNVVLYSFPIRADFTANNQFSISEGTKELMRNVDDLVTFDLYYTTNLPAQYQTQQREVEDRLRDFKRLSDNIVVNVIPIAPGDAETAQQANDAGVREFNIQQLSANAYQAQTARLGVAVQYGEKKDAVAQIDNASSIEYTLSRMLLRMTQDELPKIGFFNASTIDISAYQQFLDSQYQVESLNEETVSEDLSDLLGVLVIDDGTQENATAAAVLKQYVNDGGNVVALIEGVNVNQQTFTGTESVSQLPGVFADQGITVNKDIVFDKINNLPTQIQGQTPVSYPFWILGLVNYQELPWKSRVDSLVMLHASSVTIDESKENIVPLVATTTDSGIQSTSFTLDPQESGDLLSDEEGVSKVVGAAIATDTNRIVVLGDANAIESQVLQYPPAGNFNFLANAIDWIAADEILSNIPRRDSSQNSFRFSSVNQLQIVQWVNVFAPPILVAVFGGYWLRRRKSLTNRKYKN